MKFKVWLEHEKYREEIRYFILETNPYSEYQIQETIAFLRSHPGVFDFYLEELRFKRMEVEFQLAEEEEVIILGVENEPL